MKLIAHRGASLLAKENSVEALVKAARLGSDGVECDIRLTKDLQYVLFHDDSLQRLAGADCKVTDLTLEEMREILRPAGYGVTTLAELLADYRENAPVLLHSKLERLPEELLSALSKASIRFILGVSRAEEAARCRQYFPKEQVLAFMPKKEDAEVFARAGAGILRLWENWLCEGMIREVKETFGREVWIMARHPETGMNGNEESLDFLRKEGADGVLLNDIALGLDWRQKRANG